MGSASALSGSAMLHRQPPDLGTKPSAPRKAFSRAGPRSTSMPITSPVDFISGPSTVSTSVSLTVENTGALTATSGRGGTRPEVQPIDASDCPPIARTARSTIGTAVLDLPAADAAGGQHHRTPDRHVAVLDVLLHLPVPAERAALLADQAGALFPPSVAREHPFGRSRVTAGHSRRVQATVGRRPAADSRGI